MEIFCDIGIKNFCYMSCEFNEKITIKNFEILQFVSTGLKLIKELNNFIEKFENVNCFYIESQIYFNTKCVRIESILQSLLFSKGIKFEKINAKRKLILFNIGTKSYSKRKRSCIKLGEELIKLTINECEEKIKTLTKKDDFYDCVLMAITKHHELTGFEYNEDKSNNDL